MKNTIKLFGIIALVAVIGFSMTTCEDISDFNFTITVVNNNSNPITTVTCIYLGGDFTESTYISSSRTFTAKAPYQADGDEAMLSIHTSTTYPNWFIGHKYFTLRRNGNYTATLSSYGTLTVY
jgi:CTP:phosphocholine cytidylyltransferase-like protein